MIQVRLPLIALAAGALCLLGATLPRSVAQTRQGSDAQASLEAFKQMSSVLQHPRCQNCHTQTSYPRQGDDRRRHSVNVRRGNDGHGVAGQRCTSCHGRANNAASGVPGADEDWHLAPLSMGWEGRTLGELCRGLKDPKRNGGRTGDKIIAHLDTPLVKWAWEPGQTAAGQSRTQPPISHAEFIAQAKRWINSGTVCPD